MSGAWDRARATNGHPLHRDHTEDLETGIASAVREIDEMRAENERLRTTLGRVQELAADLESTPQVGYDSSEQWEFDTRRIIAQELLRVLEGDQQ